MENPFAVNADLQPKLAEWFSGQANTTWLQAMLDTPQGHLLIEVLRESALPAESDLHGTGDESYLARLAIAHAKQVGVRNCVETLVSLRHPSVTPTEVSQPWEKEE
jgi:hypothetical protein